MLPPNLVSRQPNKVGCFCELVKTIFVLDIDESILHRLTQLSLGRKVLCFGNRMVSLIPHKLQRKKSR